MSPAPNASFLNPRIGLPFLLVALIWGSTWWVITGQIDGVPASWAVVWRFVIAAPAMALLALATGASLRIGPKGQRLAMLVGLTQFCGNYNFVYEAERHLTSGIVAVMLSLLFVPNTLLGRVLLGQKTTARFAGGSLIAIVGIGLLFANEARTGGVGGNVWLGVMLAFFGMMAAAIANVVQANDTGRSLPMASLLAWSMAWGVVFDTVFALVTAGPPVVPRGAAFWAGTAYLAIAGSVVTFPLYFGLVRNLGAGKAAYNGVLVVVLAMFLSTLLEGYRWTGLAVAGCALALAGLVIALSQAKVPKIQPGE